MKFNNPFLFLALAIAVIIYIATLVTKKIVTSDYQHFIGTWYLLDVTYADGRKNELCGDNPIGYIMYTKDGHMSVQIMRRSREKLHSNNFLEATPEESQKIWHDFFAYAGTCSLNTKQKIITHQVATSLSPNLAGKTLHRSYRFAEDKLYLTTIEAVGNEMKQTLVWQRLPK